MSIQAGPSTQALTTSSTTQRLTTTMKQSPIISSSSSPLMPSERAKGKGLTSGTGTSSTGFSGTASAGGGVKDVVSPGELCGFVDTLLSQLETRFDEMSEQVLGRMNEMSNRIDNLETTIQDLMHGGIEGGEASTSMTSASTVTAGRR